jgi:PAS domain-containing protein
VVQGAVYVVEKPDNEPTYLELLSAYAFEQKRYFRRKILIGEGPVGTCAAEESSIYLQNVPQGYIKITSGLGEIEPRYILLEPLLMSNLLYGVLELNSFTPIEAHQINFVRKATESFAATLSNVKINLQTKKLLLQYQRQSDELAEQEEQMRLNLEQMLATQEDALYKERRMTALFDSLDVALLRVELNVDGMILSANQRFFEATGRLSEDILGKHLSSFLDIDSREFVNHALLHNAEFETYYCQLVFVGKFGQRTVVQAVFAPVVGDMGVVESLQLLVLSV